MSLSLDSKICCKCEKNLIKETNFHFIKENKYFCTFCYYENTDWLHSKSFSDEQKTISNICSEHKLTLDIFCHDCESLICYKCIIIHKSHEIEEISSLNPKNLKLIQNYEQMTKKFSQTMEKIDKVISSTLSSYNFDNSSFSIDNYKISSFRPHAELILLEKNKEVELLQDKAGKEFSELMSKAVLLQREKESLKSEDSLLISNEILRLLIIQQYFQNTSIINQIIIGLSLPNLPNFSYNINNLVNM